MTPSPIPRRAWLVTAVTSTTVVLTILDAGFVSLAFPEIEREFADTSRATLSWVSTGFFVAMASLMLAAGRLADRFTAKRVFLAGLALYAGGAALVAVAPSPAVLIAARIVQGAGAASLAPVSLAMALPEFPADRRSTAVGAWAVVGSLSGVVAPIVGAVVVDVAGWRAPFVGLAILLIVAGVAANRVLSSGQTSDVAIDGWSVPLTMLAIGGLALGLSQGSRWGWGSPGIVGALVVAAVALPVMVRRSAGNPGSLLDISLFRSRSYTVGSIASVLTQMGFFSFFFPTPLFFTDVWQYSVLAAGFALAVQQGVSAFAGLPVGRWADRVGPRIVVAVGGALAAAGLTFFALAVGSEASFLAIVVPAFTISGVGMMMNGSISTSAALRGLPDEALARATSGFYVTRRLASGLGVVAAAMLLGEVDGVASLDRFRLVWLFSAACYALSGFITWRWYETPDATAMVRTA